MGKKGFIIIIVILVVIAIGGILSICIDSKKKSREIDKLKLEIMGMKDNQAVLDYEKEKLIYDKRIDSLQSILNESNKKNQQLEQDKLNIIKSYENRYKEIADSTLISNDSIASYIADQINQWRTRINVLQ